MRYQLTEFATLPVTGKFTTTDTVTIIIYDLSTGLTVATDDASCTEIGVTGFFTWSFANLTTQPVILTNYLWVMSNTIVEQADIEVAGGYPDLIESPLGPADTCKVTVSLYDGDGTQIVEPNDLYSQTEVNTITIKNSLFASSRYFKIGAYKPSFDALTGTAFWVFPQGASVDIKLATFGISETGITIPAQTTIDLNALINL